MHAHTDFTLTMQRPVNFDLLNNIYEKIKDDAPNTCVTLGDDSISVKESYDIVWYEDVLDLAIQCARMCKGKADFDIAGVVDTSESAGEFMDFKIEFQDDVLMAAYSEWYTQHCGAEDWDDDYDEFTYDFCDEDGAPMYDENFFEVLKKAGRWYATNGLFEPKQIWLDDVHMNEQEEIDYEGDVVYDEDIEDDFGDGNYEEF